MALVVVGTSAEFGLIDIAAIFNMDRISYQ
jgi:hypothetical protein